MKYDITPGRRRFIKIGASALAAIPLLVLTGKVVAAPNASARSAMKYQNQPSSGKSCSGCVQFESGPTPTELGSCKLLAGDTEISSNGYCTGWAALSIELCSTCVAHTF